MTKQFYEELYTKEACRAPRVEEWAFPTLNHGDRSWLNYAVSGEEVRRAIFQMGADKALGPGFFQKYWALVGPSIIHFAQSVFDWGELLDGVNQVSICLLAKVEHPESPALSRLVSFQAG